MNKKTYPKVVVLKKGLIGVAVLGTVTIMILIIYNLYQSTHDRAITETTVSNKVEAVASQSDMSWYQNKMVHKISTDQMSQPVQTEHQPISSLPLQNDTKIEGRNDSQLQNEQDKLDKQELLKAMSAPIGSNQLVEDKQLASSLSNDRASVPLGSLNHTDNDQNKQGEKKAFIQLNSQVEADYLTSSLNNPISRYELQAGTIIPAILIQGINSDLPSEITGQVRSNVYDSISGKFLLIPQGAKLIGVYDSQIAYGQERLLVVWNRIIFPNGQSINLQGMSGVDMSGYGGFNDQVDNHYMKIFGSVILMSALGAGAQLSQPQNSNNPFAAPTVGQTLAQSVGTNIANTGTMITAKNINIQPTLKIRPGYEFNIFVKKDILFPSPYRD